MTHNQTTSFKLRLHTAVDSLKRLQGLAPHNSLENVDMGCFHFARSIKFRFTADMISNATAVIANSSSTPHASAWYPIAEAFHLGKIQRKYLIRQRINSSKRG